MIIKNKIDHLKALKTKSTIALDKYKWVNRINLLREEV